MTCVDLQDEEAEWVRANPERCATCNHLEIFHSVEPIEHCEVEGCHCRYVFVTNQKEI